MTQKPVQRKGNLASVHIKRQHLQICVWLYFERKMLCCFWTVTFCVRKHVDVGICTTSKSASCMSEHGGAALILQLSPCFVHGLINASSCLAFALGT